MCPIITTQTSKNRTKIQGRETVQSVSTTGSESESPRIAKPCHRAQQILHSSQTLSPRFQRYVLIGIMCDGRI